MDKKGVAPPIFYILSPLRVVALAEFINNLIYPAVDLLNLKLLFSEPFLLTTNKAIAFRSPPIYANLSVFF